MSGTDNLEALEDSTRIRICGIDLDTNTDEEVLTDIDEEEYDIRIDPTEESKQQIMSKKCENIDTKSDIKNVKLNDNSLNQTFKSCIDEIVNNISSDSDIEIIDEKLVKTSVAQTSAKPKPKPESKSNLNSIDQSSTDEPKTSAHKGTHSRYMSRVFDYNLIDRKTGFVAIDKLTESLNTVPIDKQSLVRFLCYHCRHEYKSRNRWRDHHKRRHEKKNLPAIYVKYRNIVDKKSIKANSSDQKESISSLKCPLVRIKLSTSSVSSDLSQNSKIVVKPQTNSYNKSETKVKTETKSANWGQTAQSGSGWKSGNTYRVVPQCVVCSFTPLINPMESITDHIRKEHKQLLNNSYKDLHNLYKEVMIKVNPKTT